MRLPREEPQKCYQWQVLQIVRVQGTPAKDDPNSCLLSIVDWVDEIPVIHRLIATPDFLWLCIQFQCLRIKTKSLVRAVANLFDWGLRLLDPTWRSAPASCISPCSGLDNRLRWYSILSDAGCKDYFQPTALTVQRNVCLLEARTSYYLFFQSRFSLRIMSPAACYFPSLGLVTLLLLRVPSFEDSFPIFPVICYFNEVGIASSIDTQCWFQSVW